MIIVLCLLLATLVAVVAIRTWRFKPLKEEPVAFASENFDRQKVIADLQELIRCKTVSFRNKELENNAEFDRFESLLPALFPSVYEHCSFIKVSDRGLLFHWKGLSGDKPTVLMAHYDVVPVNQTAWLKDAFSAEIEDNVLWGRGTLDTKTTFLGIMEAVNHLAAKRFVPQNDIYLAFGGDEEINGQGAPSIVAWFKAHNIQPEFVLDEGGAVVSKVFPGVSKPCAVVGIAEKGIMEVKFSIKTQGGHASTPPAHSPVAALGEAAARIEKHPFPFRLTPPALQMFDTMARYSTVLYRMIFANLWLFKPVLNLICKKSGGEMNALVRTTCALTQMQGSEASNVLPPYTWIGANIRIMCGETTESVLNHLRQVVHNEEITIEKVHGMNPSVISDTSAEPWTRLFNAIKSTWEDTIVSPYLMLACSDSRHYGEISNHVYRFSAMALSKEERAMIHGNNERIPLNTVVKTVDFYCSLIKKC